MRTRLASQENAIKRLEDQNQKLSSAIELMSANNNIPIENFLPIIPNPPPQCTSFIRYNEQKFAKFKSYGQVDSVLSKIILKHYDNCIYMSFKDGGFAVATPLTKIDKKLKRVEPTYASTGATIDFLKYMFSAAHQMDFTTDFGYSECLIFIVSPMIYSVGGKGGNGSQIKDWINANNFRLPLNITNTPLPKHTQVVVLLFELEANENLRGNLNIVDEEHKTIDINGLPIIKELNVFR